MRGTVLNPTQVHQCLNTIILALRQMIDQLLPSNTPWFAELFTDLLLQIGLVPMQELDADILKNVADKDRLQVRMYELGPHVLFGSLILCYTTVY